MEGPYKLLNSLIAHDGPIRSVCLGPSGEIVTGCQADAPCVRRWLKSANGQLEELGTPLYHDHWVTALTSLGPHAARGVHPQGCIISGCMDSKIRIFDGSGVLISTLTGHTKGIISFSWTTSGLLISGSWDGTARLWDLASNSCVLVLQPHENGVHVLGLSNGNVATVSTGEAVDGKPANFRLRIWSVSSGTMIGGPISDHDGSIRCVAALPGVNGFVTSANDGSIILRSIDGDLLGVVQHGPQEDGSPPFILDVCALSSEVDGGSMDLVSCGEDGSVHVWSGTDGVQAIPHPSCVWCALSLGDGDFLTGSHDGVLRHFTRSPDRLALSPAAEALANEFLLEVSEAQRKKRRGPSSEELAKAPRWESRGATPGTSENQVMVFNKEGAMIAAQWNSGSWVIIGEVTGSGDGGYIGETWFDHVMPVEIETATGLRQLKLGHNNGENPFVAAQRFINANSLEQGYLGQIADWITARAGNSVPTLGGAGSGAGAGRSAAVPAAPAIPAAPTFSSRVTAASTFEELPVAAKLLGKVTDLNAAVPAVDQLSASEVDLVYATLLTLCDTSRYHSSSISADQVRAVAKMALRWDAASVFPAYDVLRLLAIHPAGAEALAAACNGLPLLESALQLLTRDHSSVPFSSALTSLRFLSNLWKTAPLRSRIVSAGALPLLTQALLHQSSNPNKLVRAAVASILMNLSNGGGVPATGRFVLEASFRLLQSETESADVVLRAVRAAGTAVVSVSNAADRQLLVAGLDFPALLVSLVGSAAWQGKLSEATVQCVQELLGVWAKLR